LHLSNTSISAFILVVIFTPFAFGNESEIPAWIKNNAEWWADDLIDDSTFLQGIQFLIKDGVIVVEQEKTVFTKSLTENQIVKEHTVLIYIVGSDLESRGYAATNDIIEMSKVDLPDSVNVIVQTGGANAKEDEYRWIDFTTVMRHQIDGEESKTIENIGIKNMAESSTLSDFIIWGMKNFPAEKYSLILWDHGGGISGIGNDENFEFDLITLDELNLALETAHNNTDEIFEVIGFDACLMATIEVASTVDDYAYYMIASEELEPGDGWNYEAILSSFKNNPAQDGESIGKVVIDSYFQFYEEQAKSSGAAVDQTLTLSLVDLSEIESLNNSLEILTDNGENVFDEENFHIFGKILKNSERYGIQGQSDSGHTDISDVLTNIAINVPELETYAFDANEKLLDSVVYSKNGNAKPNANGLSVHIPLNENLKQDFPIERPQFDEIENDFQNYLSEDSDDPILEYFEEDGIIYGVIKSTDIFSFTLFFTSQDLVEDENTWEILSTDEFDVDELDNDEFVIAWDGTLPALCDGTGFCNPINSELYYNDEVVLQYIPAFIERNNEEIEVDLVYEISNLESPLFLGAVPYHEDESIIDKEVLPVFVGDKIFTYTADYNILTEDVELVTYPDPIIVDEYFVETSGLERVEFQGTFYLFLEICDYGGNCVYSEEIGPYSPIGPLEE